MNFHNVIYAFLNNGYAASDDESDANSNDNTNTNTVEECKFVTNPLLPYPNQTATQLNTEQASQLIRIFLCPK